VFNDDTRPTAGDDGWTIYLANGDSNANSGNVFVTCLA
jgi:hypothetical protein